MGQQEHTPGPVTTTLNRIREHSPCAGGWAKLLRHLGKTQADDEPLPFSVILASNGLDDALWCCRAEPQHASLWRHFAVDCAETVKHRMTDERSLNALVVARRHAEGAATDEELDAARAAAWDGFSQRFLRLVETGVWSPARVADEVAA